MKSKLQRQKEKCVKLAIKLRREQEPNCVFCNKPAITCHHFIHQSSSNYLKLKPENLVPVCKSCHFLIHAGSEQLFTGRLIHKYGMEWFDKLAIDKYKTIKDNLTYWREQYDKLKDQDENLRI